MGISEKCHRYFNRFQFSFIHVLLNYLGLRHFCFIFHTVYFFSSELFFLHSKLGGHRSELNAIEIQLSSAFGWKERAKEEGNLNSAEAFSFFLQLGFASRTRSRLPTQPWRRKFELTSSCLLSASFSPTDWQMVVSSVTFQQWRLTSFSSSSPSPISLSSYIFPLSSKSAPSQVTHEMERLFSLPPDERIEAWSWLRRPPCLSEKLQS